jgi:hypothetical protein
MTRDKRALRILLRVATAGLLAAAVAMPASAYVVVTNDNQVYEVPTRPEIRDNMVFFVLDGRPVSMRSYAVNIAKTNEINYMLDSGANLSQVSQAVQSMPNAAPTDHRLIVSNELQVKRITDARPDEPDWRLVRGEIEGSPSFSDSPGRRRAPTRTEAWPRSDRSSFGDSPGRPSAWEEDSSRARFAEEARRAYEDAARGDSGGYESAPMRPMGGNSRVESLDAEIAAEQAYLRRLTSGEEAVDDLDRAIDRSMEKIRRLQNERDDAQAATPMPEAEPSGYRPPERWESTGRFPAGSREAKWEQQLAELRDREQYYRNQQAQLPAGSSRDREVLDERIGEIEYKIEKLERKLENAARR